MAQETKNDEQYPSIEQMLAKKAAKDNPKNAALQLLNYFEKQEEKQKITTEKTFNKHKGQDQNPMKVTSVGSGTNLEEG